MKKGKRCLINKYFQKAFFILLFFSVLLTINNKAFAFGNIKYEVEEKNIEKITTQKNEIYDAIPIKEDNKEGIAKLLDAKIIKDEIITSTKDVTDMTINFGTSKPTDVYPYYRKVDGNLFVGILKLEDTETITKEGNQDLFNQKIIKENKINVSTREFDNKGKLLSTSYSWGHTNNHSSYYGKDEHGNKILYAKNGAQKLKSIRKNNADGSYTIEDTWQGNYIAVIETKNQVNGKYKINIGHYKGKIKSEEHKYTFKAMYFASLISNYMKQANLGKATNSELPNDPVNIVTGNFYSDDIDLEILDAGMTIKAKRYYNSQDERTGILGKAWRFYYESFIEQIEGTDNVKVTYPSGRAGVFTYNNDKNIYQPLQGFYDTLQKKDDGSYLLTLQNNTKYMYNTSKKLCKIINKQGNEINLVYDEQSRLSKVNGTLGKYINLTYEQNNIKTITDSVGRRITYFYNNNLLEKVMDKDGAYTKYIYENNKIKSITDKNGKVFITNYYDKFGRVIRQIDGNGEETNYNYNIETKENYYHNLKTGEKIIYQYNKNYYITKKIFSDSTFEEYNYDSKGNKVLIRNRNGYITKFEYNDRNNIIKTISPEPFNYETKISYDENNNITKIIKPNGAVENYLYDSNGNLIRVEKQIDKTDVAITTYTYDDKGRKLTETNSLGNKTIFQYNNSNPLPIKIIDAEGVVTSYTYDNANRIRSITRGNGTITYEYDYRNKITKIIDQNGNVTRMKYDNMGNLIKKILPNEYNTSTDDGLGTVYEYNDMDKRIKTTDPLGNISAYKYDYAGNLSKIINPNTYDAILDDGEGFSLLYDTNDRLINTVNPSGAKSKIKYDPLGNVIKSITSNNYNGANDDGEGVSYNYDALNRVTVLKDKDGNIINTKEYDEVGNILKSIDEKGYETLYKYNMLGWLIEKREPLKKENSITYYRLTKYQYDKLGRKIKEYKSKDYVTKNEDANNYNIIIYTYNKNNQVISVTDSTGARVRYKYNKLSLLEEEKTKINDDTFNIKKYEYDNLGRRTKEIQIIEGKDVGSKSKIEEAVSEYTYDKNSNLIQIKSPLGYKTVFRYDANNRIIKKEEEVDKQWLKESYVKASIYSPSNKVYENNLYTYKVKIDTTEKISKLNLTIQYDSRVFEIQDIHNTDNNIIANTDTIGQIVLSSTNTYDIGKTDILDIKLKAKSKLQGIGYIVFKDSSSYNDESGNKKLFTELTGQRLDMLGPDINENSKIEINDLALTAMQLNKENNSPYFQYKYDTNNDKIIDTNDLNYISEWLNKNKGKSYKQLGISQIRNKIINNSYKKGVNKVIRETSYEYDKTGNLIKETDEEGSVEYAYDLQNNLIKQVDKEGNIYSYKYDEEKNIIKEIKPENYNESTKDGKGVTYTYDYLGRRVLIRNEENQIIEKNIYDVKGNIIQQIDQKGYNSGVDDNSRYKTEYVYDIGGRLISITTPELKERKKHNAKYTYDAQNNILSVTDAEDNTTSYIRDLWGRALSIKDAKDNIITYTYDYAGNMVTSTDAKRNTTTYSYNSLNKLESIVDPQNGEINYKYDLQGRVIEKKDRKGQVITYQYNRDNNLTQRSINEENQDQYYLYNQLGRLQATISNNGIERYTYNKNGLITNKIFNNNTMLSYSYNKNNQIHTLTDSEGYCITYNYDTQSRLNQIQSKSDILANYNYIDNQVSNVTYNNGVNINYNYDKDNKVISVIHKNSVNETINNYKYTYDLIGNITQKNENGQVTNYQYDQINQLTKIIYPNNIEESLVYDINGNRQKRVLKQPIKNEQSSRLANEIITEYDYNNLNQLTKTNENGIITSYIYDNNGNVTRENNNKKGTTYYEYDGYNRLTNITNPDGSYQRNYYTIGNLRTAIEQNGIYTGFTYQNGQVISEHTSQGDLKRTNIIGYNQIATKDNTNKIYYYLHNAHKDITNIINANGDIQNAYTYDAFGNITEKEELIPNRYKYAGEQYDNVTGQYYLRARYYNPVVGRFLQEDSFRGDGLNLYAYVANNPVNYIDPTGHEKVKNTILNLSPKDLAFLSNMTSLNGIDEEHGIEHYMKVLSTLKDSEGKPMNEVIREIEKLGYPKEGAGLVELSYRVSQHGVSLAQLDRQEKIKQQQTANVIIAVYGGIIADGLINGKVMSPLYSETSAVDQLEKNGYLPPNFKLSNSTIQNVTNNGMTRVGRWMSTDEYNKMVKTGMVQEGGGGQTYAAFKKEGFMKQAANDAVYVEFDVPTSSFKITNPDLGWVRFKSPLSVEGKLAIRKGLPVPQLPKAENITLIGGK
ncbi:MAG: DUF6531 domain-containing protein [Vallitalea sp.]|jgi:RHS repeat-associated protein|nr:DUF6531 domain-containing protein [Vallitalea sp.]